MARTRMVQRVAAQGVAVEPRLFRYVLRHSRGEQATILAIILLSLPFYWVSLDVPKRIVNDAIEGRAFRGHDTIALFSFDWRLPDWLGGWSVAWFRGFIVDQAESLIVLSGVFFVLVLINGAFKFSINNRKGVLGERMLRRLRFDLFQLLMRFRPEDIRAVKPAEIAGMIKDEVEPIGGFIGDALIQPAFLGTQAATAMAFIFAQNLLLGLVAAAVVAIQALIVPALRKEQLRLGRARQLASRQLAGRVGEIVEGAAVIHGHSASRFVAADIGGRLGQLYFIRVDLFRRKFAVKYLNNLLSQLTPFFFYGIGGYFALRHQLDIGQLVAVIAAYRELPPPIKELIDWDQTRNDVTLKYDDIVAKFSHPGLMAPEDFDGVPGLPAVDAPIAITALSLKGSRGALLIDRFTATIPRPAHIAVVGASGSGRDGLAKILGRQLSRFSGTVEIGGRRVEHLTEAEAGRLIGYAGVDLALFPGSIRDNVVIALQRLPRPVAGPGAAAASAVRTKEALKSGNPLDDPAGDWIDYAAAGVAGAAALDRRILATLALAGMSDEIHRLGLHARLDPRRDADLGDRLIAARRTVHARLSERGLAGLIEPFDPVAFNASATIGENLLFGVVISAALARGGLARDPTLRGVLDAEGLTQPLIDLGLGIARSTLDMFAGLAPGSPLFERYSFIQPDDLPMFRRIVDAADGRAVADEDVGARLIGLALDYVEPRHRLGLIDAAFRSRVLRARGLIMAALQAHNAGAVEFYHPDRLIQAAPVLDNLLFGRVGHGIGNADRKVAGLVREVLADLDLDGVIHRLGLDTEVGVGGRLLTPSLRAAVDLARSLIKAPDILVLDGGLALFGPKDAAAILKRVRDEAAGRTLIAALNTEAEAEGFDVIIRFDGARGALSQAAHAAEPARALAE